MAPPVLAARCRSGANHELLRYVGATVGLGTNTFGGASETYAAGAVPTNRVIQAFGDIYQVGYDGLYIKTDPTTLTGAFTQVGAFTLVATIAAVQGNKSGVYLVYINDVPHLTGWFYNTSNQFQGYKYNLVTSTFSLGVGVGVAHTGAAPVDEIVYRNQIFSVSVDSSSQGVTTILVYNPTTDTFSTVANPGISAATRASTSLLIHDDQLQCLYCNTATELNLGTYNGTSFNFTVQVNNSIPSLAAATSRFAAFSDGTLRFAIVYDDFNLDGFAVYEIDNGLSIIDRTTTVLPASLQSISGRGGTFPASPDITTYRLRILHDANTNPLVPEWHIYIAQGNVTGQPWSVYKWNGNAALIGNAGAANDTGGDISNALPFTSLDGGARVWTPAELDAGMLLRENALGGEKLTCKGWGAVGPADKTFKVYANKKGTGDLFLCKLQGPVTGGTAALNGGSDGIVNIEANPAVTYTFAVDFANTVPAISAGERIQYYLDIS